MTKTAKPAAKGMSFVGGAAKFISRHGAYQVWPCGAPETILVGNPPKPQFVSKPRVQFAAGHYETTDPAVAGAMISSPKFENPNNWSLNPVCLPAEAQKRWQGLTRNQKRELALSMVSGEGAKEALSDLPEAIPDPPVPGKISPVAYTCPVSGCGKSITAAEAGSDDKAREWLGRHVLTTHPEWKGE